MIFSSFFGKTRQIMNWEDGYQANTEYTVDDVASGYATKAESIVRVPRTGGENQIVVRVSRAVPRPHQATLHVHGDDGRHEDSRVLLLSQEMADRCEKIARQIRQRVAGEPITDRIVSLHDPDARPIRKGKLGKPNEFGFVSQLTEVTENTKRGARGLIMPGSTAIGNPSENTLLPDTVAELDRLGIRPREVALDGGFQPGPTNDTLAVLAPDRVFIAGRQEPDSKRTSRRLPRYRTGEEGRISHLKRRYGLERRPPDLDRVGDPRLQRRHACRPNPMKNSNPLPIRATHHSLERPRPDPS